MIHQHNTCNDYLRTTGSDKLQQSENIANAVLSSLNWGPVSKAKILVYSVKPAWRIRNVRNSICSEIKQLYVKTHPPTLRSSKTGNVNTGKQGMGMNGAHKFDYL